MLMLLLWHFQPLLKNEWVEMGDPAPPHRRTHGGPGAGVLAVSGPCRRRRWPASQALQGPSVPGYDRHRRTDGMRFKTMRSRKPLAARYITHSKFNRALIQAIYSE